MEIVACPFVDDEHRLTLRLLALLFLIQFALLNLDIVFLRQPAQRFRIGYLFVLHQEVHGIATFAAGKALTDLACWRYHERGRLVVMERTQALVVNPRLAQVNKLADHIHDVDGIHDFIDGSPVYHRCLEKG